MLVVVEPSYSHQKGELLMLSVNSLIKSEIKVGRINTDVEARKLHFELCLAKVCLKLKLEKVNTGKT